MEEFWDQLKDQQIIGLMFPGSHNSGNTKELASDGKCQSVYDGFKVQIQDAAGGLRSLVNDPMLLTYFQPWNVNQHVSVTQQLVDHGIRWLHLKVCNSLEENSIAGPYNLSHIYHTHGGFTSMSLATILSDILTFLGSHPKEIAIVGLNDFYQLENQALFSMAVADFIAEQAEIQLIRAADWTKTLSELVHEKRRLAIFMGNSSTEGILPSADFLTENYDEIFQSEDFDAIKRWLQDDARAHTSSGKFYAFSAHPTKNVQTVSVNSIFSQGSDPMLEFQRRWFQEPYFPSFVEQLVENNRSLVLNGISTDFVEESGVFSLTMRLQGLCHAASSTSTVTTTSTSVWTSTTMTAVALMYRISASFSAGLHIWLPLLGLANYHRLLTH